jgi:hypothetical protein
MMPLKAQLKRLTKAEAQQFTWLLNSRQQLPLIAYD